METFLTQFEIKAVSDVGEYEGYAAIFKNVDRQRDRIMEGAFLNTLKENEGKVPLLMGHNTGRIAGFGVGAKEDAKGLKVWGQFTLDASDGKDAHALAKHAATLNNQMRMSIGYGIRKDGATWDEEKQIRNLSDLDLYEYSLVAIPANPRAGLTAVKSADELATWTIREFESHLRDVGYSVNAARTIASGGFKALTDQRDADGGGALLLSELVRKSNQFDITSAIKGFLS